MLTTTVCSELAREKMWSRIHLIPLLQAEEDRDQVRRYYSQQAMEKELLGAETKAYNSDRLVSTLHLDQRKSTDNVQVRETHVRGHALTCYEMIRYYTRGAHAIETSCRIVNKPEHQGVPWISLREDVNKIYYQKSRKSLANYTQLVMFYLTSSSLCAYSCRKRSSSK